MATRNTKAIFYSGCLALLFAFSSVIIFKYNEFILSKQRQMDLDRHINACIHKMNNNDGIIRVEAELHGQKFGFGYRDTERFAVPPEYNKAICKHFSGQVHPARQRNERSERKYWLGWLDFRFSAGERLQIRFFTAGKGVLEYCVDGNYYFVDTGDTDGGISLLMLLDEAYKTIMVADEGAH